MLRPLPLVLAAVVLAGCGSDRGIQNEAAVRQAVIDYLSKRTDLSLSAMEVNITSVSFRQNEADAMVAFRPKGAPASSGMAMRYTLERQGSRWVVKGRGHSQAGQSHGMGQPGQPASGGAGTGGGKPLPPGHPPLGGGSPPPGGGK
jgi:hypothetical protein